jgi:short subunit dehydrogenase-like uncharacterized protein
MPDPRDLDVVLYGATGYVGVLVAEHLVRHAPAGARIALAGRDRSRLEGVRDSLGPAAADWSVLVADAADTVALAALAARTTAVATTVGPYATYGLPMAAACAAAGTHYADLTGEVRFVRRVIDELQDTAVASGARIVNACGFDSIPSDLGMFVLDEAVRAARAGVLEEATLVVTALVGGVSGGTLASIAGQIDEMRRSAEVRRLVRDPYSLSPDRAREPDLGRQGDVAGVRRVPELGGWIAPFLMAGFNTRIVRRSNALSGYRYGRTLRYREVMGYDGGPGGWAKAVATAAGTGGLAAGLAAGRALPPTRALLDRYLPSPGEGPSEAARAKGRFEVRIHGRTSTSARFVATVAAQGDPGYGATSVMFGESVLALAFDGDRLPDVAGVLTPATGIGVPLVDRLRAAGFTFTVSGP